MKRLFAILIMTSSITWIVACGNSSGGSNPSGTIATTPQTCNNQGLPGAYTNCAQYTNYYGTQGSYPNGWYWPTNYNTGVGSCGCNPGFNPVQGPYGVACAPSNFMNSYPGAMYGGYPYWNSAQNGVNYGQGQITYPGSTGYSSCGQSTAQGCDVRLNNCIGGGRCVPVAGGSTIGLCVRY